MARTFLIHGYVEDPTIFDKLVPYLPAAEFVRINLADEFERWQPVGLVNVQRVANYIADCYEIEATDVIIGHSMGGWIAIHIKQLTNAIVIQVASWTDQRKIRLPTHNLRLLKMLLYSGITQSRPLLNYFQKQYPFQESADLYCRLMNGMRTMSRRYLYQQLQTLFAPVSPLTVSPELRIHARRDSIVARPSEPFVEVPGDHFGLVFYPEQVAEAILTVDLSDLFDRL
ncbi:alpha/beta hydrolase [Spirosoma agri]|uniref:Alpha/beta hydrolase n=1 Tax=Spirosoma agri TaxID=1987381 RepID=A0A6M0IQE8_9BACT|nr:alpha/beta hydrolase [Spirosoma agri]NEU70508.1 alpha/beta hydrolase [Spirosoma agri]